MASDSIFPVGFHFLVDFQKLGDHFQVPFMEVSGLDMLFKTIPKVNDIGTRVAVPEQLILGNITVKRSVTPIGKKDAFTMWVNKSFATDKGKFVIAYDAIIKLLDNEGAPIAGWKCSCTYPVHWTLSAMNAEKSELAIETVVLACNRIERITEK